MKNESYFRQELEESLRIRKTDGCEVDRIIDEYMAQNKIDYITEDELIDIFGELILPPERYYPYGEGPYVEINYKDSLMLSQDINPYEGWESKAMQMYLDEVKQTEYGIDLGDYDCIQPYEVSDELPWCNHQCSFEEALQEASIMDRMYLEMDEKGNLNGIGLFDKGKHINEFFEMLGPDFEYMKVDEPDWLKDGELEYSLADDFDYFLSIRTKTVNIYIDDLIDLDEVLQEPIHETIFRQIIHLEESNKKFLIVVTIDEQHIFYEVFHQQDSNNCYQLKPLGWDVYYEAVLHIIIYYLETGLTIDALQ
jgi:hypothetical protein